MPPSPPKAQIKQLCGNFSKAAVEEIHARRNGKWHRVSCLRGAISASAKRMRWCRGCAPARRRHKLDSVRVFRFLGFRCCCLWVSDSTILFFVFVFRRFSPSRAGAIRIREADAGGPGAAPLPAGGINKASPGAKRSASAKRMRWVQGLCPCPPEAQIKQLCGNFSKAAVKEIHARRNGKWHRVSCLRKAVRIRKADAGVRGLRSCLPEA
jgi:hypothetical protein